MSVGKCLALLYAAYLVAQAISDAKTGMVYSFWNDLATLVSSGLMVVCLVAKPDLATGILLADTMVIFAGCLILCAERKGVRIMQPSDAKVIWQIFCISFVALGGSYALYATAFSVLISSISFMFYYRAIKRADRSERKPYFPFLALGYGVAMVFGFGFV